MNIQTSQSVANSFCQLLRLEKFLHIRAMHTDTSSRIQPFSLGAIHSYAIFYLPRCCKVYNYQFGASFRHFRLKMAVIFYNYYIVRCRHFDRGETSLAEKD